MLPQDVAHLAELPGHTKVWPGARTCAPRSAPADELACAPARPKRSACSLMPRVPDSQKVTCIAYEPTSQQVMPVGASAQLSAAPSAPHPALTGLSACRAHLRARSSTRAPWTAPSGRGAQPQGRCAAGRGCVAGTAGQLAQTSVLGRAATAEQAWVAAAVVQAWRTWNRAARCGRGRLVPPAKEGDQGQLPRDSTASLASIQAAADGWEGPHVVPCRAVRELRGGGRRGGLVAAGRRLPLCGHAQGRRGHHQGLEHGHRGQPPAHRAQGASAQHACSRAHSASAPACLHACGPGRLTLLPLWG